MKRSVAFILAVVLLLSACGKAPAGGTSVPASPSPTPVSASADADMPSDTGADHVGEPDTKEPALPEFTGLDDPDLCSYVEDAVYQELLDQLNSDGYFVENVSAVYVSKEYLETVEYNSRTNIFFGYSLADLDAQFEGTRYVFTLGENGETTVEPFEEYDDDTYKQVIKNVAIGSGVILICVTVSAVTAGTAPAISLIFATSAKTGAVYALSAGSLGAVSAGVVTGVQTGDLDQALKAAALVGSEEFKWGAVSGALAGGISKTNELMRITPTWLTLNEAAAIQRESKYDPEIIKNFRSREEYELYKAFDLYDGEVNGKHALLQKIDWDFIGDIEDGRTNAQRVQNGLVPLDPTGHQYELHHIGQSEDSPLAILTWDQHHGKGSTSILHQNGVPGVDHGTNWAKIRNAFWNDLLRRTWGGA